MNTRQRVSYRNSSVPCARCWALPASAGLLGRAWEVGNIKLAVGSEVLTTAGALMVGVL